MSHTAAVAIQVQDDAYDIHLSDNGADNLQLEPLLEEYADTPSTLSNGNLGCINHVEQMAKWQESDYETPGGLEVKTGTSNQALNPRPIAEGIPLKALAHFIDFADLEAVYVVRDGDVETYFPVWLEPNVVKPWRNNLSVEVYRSGKIESSPIAQREKIEETKPLRVIDCDTLAGNFLDDTIVERIVREHHANIYALVEKGRQELEEGDTDVSVMMIHTDSFIVLTHVTGEFEPLPQGDSGIFVEIEERTQRQIELAAAELRFNVGAGLNALRRDPTDDELAEAAAELSIEAFLEFKGEIAEFSPPPYSGIYEALRQVDDVSSEMSTTVAEHLLKRVRL